MFDDNISDRLYEDFNYDGLAFGFKFRDDKKHLCINTVEVGINWSKMSDLTNKELKKEADELVYQAIKEKVKPFVDKIKKEMKIDGER